MPRLAAILVAVVLFVATLGSLTLRGPLAAQQVFDTIKPYDPLN